MRSFVYLVTNRVNGKRYVGKTNRPSARWYAHKMHAVRNDEKTALYSAMQKHGIENFTFEVIESFDSEEDALFFEGWWIEYLGTRAPHGYNLTDGGEGASGAKRSEETRRKMSIAQLGRPHPPVGAETRAKIAAASRGRRHSAESRALMSRNAVGMRGKRHSPEARAKMSAARRSRPTILSNAGRARIVARHTNKEVSAETRTKLRAANLGKTLSAEHRAKLSAAKRGRKLSPEHVAKILPNIDRRGRRHSAEVRAKISATKRLPRMLWLEVDEQ